MKILHLIETRGPGGAESVLLNLANKLSGMGFDNYGLFIKEGWIENQFRRRGYDTILCTSGGKSGFLLFVKLLTMVRTQNIDVIHAHEFYMSVWASLVSVLFGVKLVCTIHGLNYHCDKPRRRFLLRFISRHATLSVVSEDVKKYICANASVLPDNVVVIENGILIPDLPARKALREELGLNSTAVLVGTIGRLHPVKGHRFLIAAANKVCEKYPDVFFYIAGEGGERGALTGEIDQYGLHEKVCLLGTRTDLGNLLSSCDIFVLPSLSEGTSLALLEAMSVGLPIIATKVGNNPNLIRSSSQGMLINPKDSEEIFLSISDIIDNKRYVTRNNENIEVIKNRYSLKVMVDRYVRLYRGETKSDA